MQVIQVTTVALIFLIAFIGFNSFGRRDRRIFIDPEEKRSFDRLVAGWFGTGATISAIFGAVTSLATVYVFFLGSSKLFGWAILACVVSLLLSYKVTNRLTESIVANSPALRARYSEDQQTGSSISMLFWGASTSERRVALITKYISLVSAISTIWLEFAVFSDMSGYISNFSLPTRCLTFLLIASIMILFVSKFGLRGFAIADIYLGPIVVFGSACVLIGIFLTRLQQVSPIDIVELFRPVVSELDAVLFVCHVFILNSLIVLVSEAHWLRRWVFGTRETTLQSAGTITTGITWLVIIAAGLIGASASGEVGEQGVAALLRNVGRDGWSPLFLIAFWAAASAALFSVCDAQLYSSLVVWNFSTQTGEFHQAAEKPRYLLLWSFVCGLIGTVIYALVKFFNIPIEKLIFILIPISVNIVPAMVARAIDAPIRPEPIMMSVIGFLIISCIGLAQPEHAFSFTLAAIGVPVMASSAVFLSSRKKVAP